MLMPDDFMEVLAKTWGPRPKITLGERKCEQCAVQYETMVLMAPGRDGVAWYLCVTCWKHGLSTKTDEKKSEEAA